MLLLAILIFDVIISVITLLLSPLYFLCCVYVASGKALFSIFGEIIRILSWSRLRQHDAGFSSCSQPLPSYSSVLYVQSNRKIVAKYLYSSANEKKQNYRTLLCLCLENYWELGVTTKKMYWGGAAILPGLLNYTGI